MKKKLIQYILISSPILTIYGVSPFYIFDILTLENSAHLFLVVLSNVIIYWLTNLVIFYKLSIKKNWVKYFLSYFLGFFLQITKVLLVGEPFIYLRSTIEQYLLYPVITTIALNTIILIILNSLINQNEKQKAEQTIADLKIKNLEAQKQVLMQQLQPHFLFNALSVLKSLIKEDTALAESYTLKLSNFLRYSVESYQTEIVSVQEELDFVQNYIALQKIRFENSFAYQIDLPEDILTKKIPVFSIQLLVENAFKHNYFTESNPLHIQISYADHFIHVENNIVSLKVTNRSGTGLNNLAKRYQLIAGKDIVKEVTESKFLIKIPILES